SWWTVPAMPGRRRGTCGDRSRARLLCVSYKRALILRPPRPKAQYPGSALRRRLGHGAPPTGGAIRDIREVAGRVGAIEQVVAGARIVRIVEGGGEVRRRDVGVVHRLDEVRPPEDREEGLAETEVVGRPVRDPHGPAPQGVLHEAPRPGLQGKRWELQGGFLRHR